MSILDFFCHKNGDDNNQRLYTRRTYEVEIISARATMNKRNMCIELLLEVPSVPAAERIRTTIDLPDKKQEVGERAKLDKQLKRFLASVGIDEKSFALDELVGLRGRARLYVRKKDRQGLTYDVRRWIS